MANYNVFIEQEGGPKTNPVCIVEYPENTTTGTGHTSGSPLELEQGDTLTFDLADTSIGPGGVTISGFSVFTDNSNIIVTNISGALVKTVATGGVTTNTLTFTKSSNNTTATDNLFVKRIGDTPPVMDIANHFNNQAASVTVQVDLTSNGSGGTLKYAAGDSASTPPSTGWQTSNQFTQARETTKYYWASQDEDTAGKFSSSSKVEVAANPVLTAMPSASAAQYGIQVYNDQNRLAFSSRRRTLVLQYTNTYTLAAGANTTISNVANANDKDQVAIFIEGIGNYSHTGTGNAVKISARTSNSVTITNSGSESKTFRVKIMRVT